ncbi:MAG: hypothetical protein ACREU9_08740, partial [Gammaproteobacteria bacterium]
ARGCDRVYDVAQRVAAVDALRDQRSALREGFGRAADPYCVTRSGSVPLRHGGPGRAARFL